MRYTKEEKRVIIAKCRAVAVAVAELWDAMRDVELRTGCELDNELELYSSLASGCNTPPSPKDLSDTDVWDVFQSHVEVK